MNKELKLDLYCMGCAYIINFVGLLFVRWEILRIC